MQAEKAQEISVALSSCSSKKKYRYTFAGKRMCISAGVKKLVQLWQFPDADETNAPLHRCTTTGATRYNKERGNHHMNFTRLDELRAKLKTMRPLNETELKRLRGEFIVENTYNSNAIEGNTLTLRETALILQGITIGEKPVREHLEAIGHRDAFEYVIFLADKDTQLTEWIIKEIHSLVLINDARNKGVYRGVPVAIMGAAHTPPSPYLVPVQMEQLIKDYDGMKQEKHIIEAIADFHLRFEGIHPFIDGNGRTGRLVLNLELIKAGLLPVDIKFVDRRKYYDCFDHYYRDGHTPETLAQLIAGYEIQELEQHIKILEK